MKRLLASIFAMLTAASLVVVSAQPTATPNSAYAPGVNAIVVQGGGSAAEVAVVVVRDSGMRVRALWMYVAANWLYHLPESPTVDGGLSFFPQTGAAYAVLQSPDAERTITLADNGSTVYLTLGERFAVDMSDSGRIWQLEVDNPNVVRGEPMIAIFPPPSRTYWVAIGLGETTMTGTGDLPCYYASPPCLGPTAPSMLFSVRLVVQ